MPAMRTTKAEEALPETWRNVKELTMKTMVMMTRMTKIRTIRRTSSLKLISNRTLVKKQKRKKMKDTTRLNVTVR